MRTCAALLLAGMLALCASAEAAVSRLKLERGVDREALHDYDAVVVGALDDAVKDRPKAEDHRAQFDKDVALVSERIVERLYEKLEASGKYRDVSRADPDDESPREALLIDGKLTEFKRANVATRYIGLGAGSKLVGVVTIRDAESGKQFAHIDLNFSSSGIPGFTNLVQTIDAFIEGIAVRVADEILIAQDKLHREQTGRSARLREKYKK